MSKLLIKVDYGKVCLPREIITVARSAKRGLLLEIVSEENKPYALLLKNGDDSFLYAIHKCYATSKGLPCKHLRTAIALSERWLNTKLPRDVNVSPRWLKDRELVAAEDLTCLLLNKQGKFKTITFQE